MESESMRLLFLNKQNWKAITVIQYLNPDSCLLILIRIYAPSPPQGSRGGPTSSDRRGLNGLGETMTAANMAVTLGVAGGHGYCSVRGQA